MAQTFEVATYLNEKGLKPSYARIRILEYLLDRKNHPTVDMIYQELSKDMPTLSRTTVYNTLNSFLENGVVRLIGIDEQEMRYDADITAHAHFRCDHCKNIFDLKLDTSQMSHEGLEDYEIREMQLYIKGLCPDCKKLTII